MGQGWESLTRKERYRETGENNKSKSRKEEGGGEMTMCFVSWALGFLTGLMFLVVWIDTDNIKKKADVKKIAEMIEDKNRTINALKDEIRQLKG